MHTQRWPLVMGHSGSPPEGLALSTHVASGPCLCPRPKAWAGHHRRSWTPSRGGGGGVGGCGEKELRKISSANSNNMPEIGVKISEIGSGFTEAVPRRSIFSVTTTSGSSAEQVSGNWDYLQVPGWLGSSCFSSLHQPSLWPNSAQPVSVWGKDKGGSSRKAPKG